MVRFLASFLVSCLLTGHVAAIESLPGANVESLLAAARERSPELRMARLEAEAAGERIAPAGALPDPVLRVELENITRNGSQGATLSPSRVGDTKYTLMQPVPFWGKRDLRRDVAAAEADAARGRTGETWAELAARIKGLYAQFWQTSRTLQVTRENVALADQLERLAQARYAGGLVPQQDAIRAQVERSMLETELVAMENERRQLVTFVNATLARPADAPLAEPLALRPLPAMPNLAPPALAERLHASNPQLAIEGARRNAAEKSRELAYRNRFPDFTVGVVPMQVQNRVDSWSLMVEMNIPLQQGTRRAQEREAERMLEAAEARQEAIGHRMLGDLAAAAASLEAARETERIAAGRLLPQADLTFKAALAGYETGKVDFATLLDAQKQIRNARLAIIRAQASQQQRLAEIERLLGEDL